MLWRRRPLMGLFFRTEEDLSQDPYSTEETISRRSSILWKWRLLKGLLFYREGDLSDLLYSIEKKSSKESSQMYRMYFEILSLYSIYGLGGHPTSIFFTRLVLLFQTPLRIKDNSPISGHHFWENSWSQNVLHINIGLFACLSPSLSPPCFGCL